jgi:hypothetical protein
MIQANPFLDPRGKPANGLVEFIGGPLDGRSQSMHCVAPRLDGGRYEYADTRPWAYLWVPS